MTTWRLISMQKNIGAYIEELVDCKCMTGEEVILSHMSCFDYED
jgi:hypothetical protein